VFRTSHHRVVACCVRLGGRHRLVYAGHLGSLQRGPVRGDPSIGARWAELQDALGLHDKPLKLERDESALLKRCALFALSAITLALIGLIAFPSDTEKEIPDLVSGLTGSGIGAIAGLLSPGSPREAVAGSSP